ncbi:MAG: insulinase family protein [Deltaproteobacteria bacterium]|nr:insulinase family protein [Deltaproteobacteria bacterium]TLN03783.1 MAG: insulinase family protein [bacterium]
MITKSVLHNGIRVISETMPHSHSVSIGIWITNGSRNDQIDINGASHFIEHLLFKGTPTRNALDIAREIDSVGGVLNAFTCREYVCYYAKVLDEALPKAVELLADIFLNSLFDQADIEKERKVVFQEIWMLKDNPDSYIHDLFCQNLWKSHPLGMSIIGTEETVGRISRETLLDFRNKRFCAEDIIIAVAGNVVHDDLMVLLEKLFSDVTPGAYAKNESTPAYKKQINLNNKDLEQVHLCLGTKALPQNSPKRYVGYIINTILGGGISSRLFQEVREKRGLAYSVYSYILSHSDAGTFVVYAGTKKEQLFEVIEVILQLMKKMKSEPVTSAEMLFSIDHLKGNLLLSLESTDNRMTKLAKNEIYFDRQISIPEIVAGLERVTTNDIIDLCNELFQDRFLTLELMGKLDDLSIKPSSISL